MRILIYCISISMFLLLGCSHKPHENDEHGHESEAIENGEHDHEHEGEASFKYTAYSSELEVFAEATPLIVGEGSEVLAQFTNLSDFSPVKEGKLTVTLVVGATKIKQVEEAPERPGIYHIELQPGKSGKGRLDFKIETPNGERFITIPDVEVFEDEHEAEHEAEEAAIAIPNAVTFTKEQSWKVDFATGNPAYEPFGSVIKTTAMVTPAQGDEAVITAKTSGVVVFSGDMLAPGTAVPKGKMLFSISGKSMADNNMAIRFNEAKNNFEKAKADYERISELAKDQIVSQKDLLQSKTEYENAKVVFESLKENFNENGQSVSSPVKGYIKHLHVSQGEFVEAGQPVLVVAQNKNLFLKAEVQQKYAAQLVNLETATIQPSADQIFTLEELNGDIVSWSKNVSDESYLIPVTLQVENNKNLFPGSIVDLNLICEATEPSVTVPNSALIEEQGNFFVFAQINPESFEKKEVKIGQSNGISTVIKSGISPDERIVTRGGILVKLASVSNNLDPHAGHVH